MKRRDVLSMIAGSAVLAAPPVARAQGARTLKYVPVVPVSVLDPVWGAGYPTRVHAQAIFDTLYGLDETFTPHPQMAERHVVDDGGKTWTIHLRQELQFHDGTPVLARDAVASIRRFAARDGFGQDLMATTEDLSAPDDRTLRFRLRKPFPHLPAALAGSSTILPCIMPERLARTDPFTQVTEMIGSGPYRFLPSEFNAGARAVYERFAAYVPREGGRQSYTAGPKIAHFDRVEAVYLGDAVTSAAALLRGEVDWLDRPPYDQLPVLRRGPDVVVEIRNTAGAIAIMRFNHLHPPFDNPAIRHALLGAVEQADVMTVVAGADRSRWQDRVGLFGPGSPLANDAGINVMDGPRDYSKVRRDLSEAGYRGEPIAVLGVTGTGNIAPISQVGVDQLRKAGMNVDLRVIDAASLGRRVLNKESPDKGGWNVHFNILEGLFNANPSTNYALRADGKTGLPGWPTSPEIEALRGAWLDAADIAEQRRIVERMQLLLWRDVPYVPMGHWVPLTARRRDLVGLPWGFPAFYGVRRA
jgi:peptide/nickel transport system substrate-binding protein